MIKILIDTDVILDLLFDRKPFESEASEILALCETKQIEGYVTAIMISNIYYLLKKTAKHHVVIESIKKLLTILNIALTDKETIKKALYSNFKDFEDSLQNYSAENTSNIKIIVTRNIKDYKHSSLSVMTPKEFLDLLKQNF